DELSGLLENREMAGEEIFRLLVSAERKLTGFGFLRLGNAADNFKMVLRQGGEDLVIDPDSRAGAEMSAIAAVGVDDAAIGARHIHRRGLVQDGVEELAADEPLNGRSIRSACVVSIRINRHLV